MKTVLLITSIACNVWFLFLLLYDRIMETRPVRFFRDIARVWNALHAGEQKKNTGQIPAQAVDIIGKSHFKMTPNRTMATIPAPQAATSEEGIELSEEDTTFDDGNSKAELHPAQIPEEKLDEVFSNIPPSEMKYGEDEPDDETSDRRQASGCSFDDIDKAVDTIRKDSSTDKEMYHAGKVLTELEGTELFTKITESMTDDVMGERLAKAMTLFVDTVNKVVSQPKKKEFFIPDNIDEFDIRDYV